MALGVLALKAGWRLGHVPGVLLAAQLVGLGVRLAVGVHVVDEWQLVVHLLFGDKYFRDLRHSFGDTVGGDVLEEG